MKSKQLDQSELSILNIINIQCLVKHAIQTLNAI
jgi:hypothetical protein